MKILALSDYSHRFVEGVAQTGFGRVNYHILSYLHSKGVEVIEVGVGYQGQFISSPPPWPVYSPHAYGRPEGQDCVPLLANQLDVDAVFLLADVPDIGYLVDPINYRGRQNQPLKEEIIAHIDVGRWKKLAYTVIDCSGPMDHLPRDWERTFRGYDGIAVASKWAQTLVEKNFGVRPAYIPHGVDTDRFKGMDKTAARSRFGIDPEAFVIGGVGVNRRRKMIPAWFETVAKFVEQTRAEKVLLWLNSYRVPEDPGYDMKALADQYEFEKLGIQAVMTERMPEEALSYLYPCFDMGINLSNEGFGMVPLEMAACRIPCMITDFASSETVTDAFESFLKIPPKAIIPQPGNIISWAWPDTDVAADRVAEYHREKKLRTGLKRSSWEHAQRYSWANVLPKFERWLTDVVEADEPQQVTVEVV